MSAGSGSGCGAGDRLTCAGGPEEGGGAEVMYLLFTGGTRCFALTLSFASFNILSIVDCASFRFCLSCLSASFNRSSTSP